jgi:hypothetical protein
MFGLVQWSSVSLTMSFINATQLSGMVSFGSAALFSAANWRAVRGGKRQWGLITIVSVSLAAECWIGVRHRAHQFATDWLVAHNLYDARYMPQGYLLATVAAAGGVLGLLVVARAGKWSVAGRAAWLATMLSLVLFLTETISLHGLDAVLYRPLGPIAVLGWLWILLGLAISLSARAKLRLQGTLGQSPIV